jgi:hypothetical protein
MKTTKSLLAALIFLTSVTASVKAFAADGVVEKDPFVAGSYCHQKFQAMTSQSLDNDEPVLKNSNSADVVDFYGNCNETAVGQDQVQEQKLELQHRFTRDYED